MRGTVGLVAAKAMFGATLAIGFASVAHAHPNIQEDDPGWSCVDDGNRVCGPNNDEGKPAGCYDDGGVLAKAWPCNPWSPADGWSHGDGTITYPDRPWLEEADGIEYWCFFTDSSHRVRCHER